MKLSPHMTSALAELFQSVAGQPETPVIVRDVHHSILYALERRELIRIEAKRTGKRIKRVVSLTEKGRRLILETATNATITELAELPSINATRSKYGERVTIQAQIRVDRADGAETIARIENWKQHRRFIPVLHDALALYDTLERGSYATLTAMFPGVIEQLYKDIRQQVEHDLLHGEFIRHLAARVATALPDAAKMPQNEPKFAYSSST